MSAAVEQQIDRNGVTEFYVGNHGKFDALACRALRAAKKEHPAIHCYLVTAYHPGMVKLEVPEGFDGIFYPLERSVPPRVAIPSANREMIRRSDVLIAAVCRPGRSREVLEYAREREKRGLIQITNLFDK